ncbi:MAG: tetratricopeptide repeat protein [Planctomycetes bacterium]|nr:tetratricopeptide repeat protein [Planctomycetota bacterium]
MAERTDDPTVSRVLIEKRCEVYSQVAGLHMDLEEALADDDGERVGYLLRDLRRALRSALALLNDETYRQLVRVESLARRLPGGGEPLPGDLAEELTDQLQLLHVKLARAIKQPGLQDMEQIVGLPGRLRQRMAADHRELDAEAKRHELEAQCWQLEAEARELVSSKNYSRAAKSIRRALRLDPERAVFHNDLGVVLSLMGRNEEALEFYRRAVELNETLTSRRTDEWTTSYYNLGTALRRASLEALKARQTELATERMAEAQRAFGEYTRLNLAGPKVDEARKILEQIRVQLERLQAGAS